MDNKTGRKRKIEKNTRRIVYAFMGLVFCFSVFVLSVNYYGLSFGGSASEDEEDSAVETATVMGDREWRYMDTGGDPGSGNVWTTLKYDADSWKTGTGSFAEEASGVKADVALNSKTSGGMDTPTFFFRKEFHLDSTGWVRAILGNISYSDAVIVYLNGEIIFAGNVPEGGYHSNRDTGCAMTPDGVSEAAFTVTDMSMLRQGTNVIAVELHQQDAAKGSAYFAFPKFDLSETDADESDPQIDRLFLEQGDDEEQIYVNWVTDSADFYEVQYMTAKEYEHYNNPFPGIAETVLMGRTYDERRKCYVHRAPVSRLRTGDDYVCRIARVGSRYGSEEFRFEAAGNQTYTFAVLGDGPIENARQLYAKDAASAAGKADGAEGGGRDERAAGRIDFIPASEALAGSGQPLLRQIPISLLDDGNARYFTYPDSLIIVPDQSASLDEQEKFIRKTTGEVKRKWVIVAMNRPQADMESFGDVLADAGVDIVISSTGGAYERTELSGGKVLYICAGTDKGGAVFVDVDKDALKATAYDTAAGKKTDEYVLRRGE